MGIVLGDVGEHSGNLRGTFREIQRTFGEHSGNIRETNEMHTCRSTFSRSGLLGAFSAFCQKGGGGG
jgi:hypothetical protein